MPDSKHFESTKEGRRFLLFVLTRSILGFLIIFIAISIIPFLLFSPVFMPSYQKCEKIFQRDKEYLSFITTSIDYRNLYITDLDDIEEHFGDPEDESIKEAMEYLLQRRKYGLIKAGNGCFEFQVWATLNKGCGIAYSYDNEEPYIEFLTKLEPLSEKGWYYYVSDFDTYR